MIRRRILLSFAIAACAMTSNSARADDCTSVLDRYAAEQLELRATASPLLFGGIPVYRGGREVEDDHDALFAPSPSALAHLDEYRTLRTWGSITTLVSMALVSAGVVLLAVDEDREGVPWLPLGLIVAGAGVSFGSSALLVAAASRFSDAVAAYNADLRERLKQRPVGPTAGIRLSLRL